MIKLNTQELTAAIFSSISAKEIIYAEIASPGAMGNAGGILLYIATNDGMVKYENNRSKDKELYEAVYNYFYENSRLSSRRDFSKPFKHYSDGMGSLIFILMPVRLGIEETHFVHNHKGEDYEIKSSVSGVFLRLKSVIEWRRSRGGID